MKLIAACCMLAIAAMQLAPVAEAAVAVGLYAPDRYDGIPEMCLMPMDFGYCRAKVKRYYFDMRRMKCNMFYWGGCAGNINNFKSLEECSKICLEAYGEGGDTSSRENLDAANNNFNTNSRNAARAIYKNASIDGSKNNATNVKNFRTTKNLKTPNNSNEYDDYDN